MFLFAAPLWLGALPVVAAAGAWGIWRGNHRPRRVSSIRLWQGQTAGSARRRAIDPVWLLVFIAALLAAAALAGPAWAGGSSTAPPAAELQWTIRSLGDSAGPGAAEAWVRLPDGGHLPGALTLAIETDAGDQGQDYSRAQLNSGIAVTLPGGASRATLSLVPQNAGAAALPLARQSFSRPLVAAFDLLGSARADPALQRVFAIQPGARRDDPTVGAAVLLLSDPATAEAALAEINGPALVVAQGEVPLPGLTPGTLVSANAPRTPAIPAQQDAALAMPGFIHLDHVHVAAWRAATLSPEWHVLAAVAGQPWIALRQEGQRTMIWLASLPSGETDWPKDPSFVLFFSEMAHRALSSSPTTTSSARWIDWHPLNDAAPIPAAGTPPILPLNPYVGAAAIALLITATALLALRTRG